MEEDELIEEQIKMLEEYQQKIQELVELEER